MFGHADDRFWRDDGMSCSLQTFPTKLNVMGAPDPDRSTSQLSQSLNGLAKQRKSFMDQY